MAERKKSGAAMGEPGRKMFRHGSFRAFLFLFALLAALFFGGMEVGLLLVARLSSPVSPSRFSVCFPIANVTEIRRNLATMESRRDVDTRFSFFSI